MRPCSSTRIVSARRTVDSRWAITFTQKYVPNEFAGQHVRFLDTFLATVDLNTAFPAGRGNPASAAAPEPGDLGAATSVPLADPANSRYIYQRFQRAIMHYDADCRCTERL